MAKSVSVCESSADIEKFGLALSMDGSPRRVTIGLSARLDGVDSVSEIQANPCDNAAMTAGSQPALRSAQFGSTAMSG